MSPLPCGIASAVNSQLDSLGASPKDSAASMDKLAKQANSNMGFFDAPILRKAFADFASAAGAALVGAATQLTSATSTLLKDTMAGTSALISMVFMMASAGTQVRLLLVSQLKREVNIRIVQLQLLQYHYNNIYKIVKLLQAPQSISYKKLFAILPYVKKAERLLDAVYRAQNSGPGMPSRYKFGLLTQAFNNVERATDLLSADGSEGGTLLGQALLKTSVNSVISKRRLKRLGQQLAKDLILQPLLQSLSYVEELTWHYMRVTSLLPIPFVTVNAIFKPNNYTEQLIKKNGVTGASVTKFSTTGADRAVSILRDDWIAGRHTPGGQEFTALDLLKGLVPTNVVINSLISAVIDFPEFSANLEAASKALVSVVLRAKDTVTDVREDMEGSLKSQDNDIVVAAKEALWLSKLNTLLVLRAGFLPALEGQALIEQDAANMDTLATWLKENQDNFQEVANMPGYITKSIHVLGAPFSKRALEESLVTCTTILKQLKIALEKDYRLVGRLSSVGEPLSQFTELLNLASKAAPPIGSIASSLLTGQLQNVLGVATALSLGTYDTLKGLFNSDCNKTAPKVDTELQNADELSDIVDEYSFKGPASEFMTP
jgi:hypothetical protein